MTKNTKAPKPAIAKPSRLTCSRCGRQIDIEGMYSNRSAFFKMYNKIPFCKDCIDDIYQEYYEKYKNDGKPFPEKKAVERICMAFDIYYRDSILERTMSDFEKTPETPLIFLYIRNSKLGGNYRKTYDDTLRERYDAAKDEKEMMSIYNNDDIEFDSRVDNGKEIFGPGFDRSDYIFLSTQYEDWISKHECNTKSQEELFKQICLTQLQLNKAQRAGNISDVKALTDMYIKQTDAAKLQPKQNSGDAASDNQTFGTLIDKIENTRPIDECDPQLKDVDGIQKYINMFFRSPLMRMFNLKNPWDEEYKGYMEQYTVNKPEYNEDEADADIYNIIFSKQISDDGDDL